MGFPFCPGQLEAGGAGGTRGRPSTHGAWDLQGDHISQRENRTHPATRLRHTPSPRTRLSPIPGTLRRAPSGVCHLSLEPCRGPPITCCWNPARAPLTASLSPTALGAEAENGFSDSVTSLT
ncbi:cysteine-rich protein 2-like [Platysternon megacephalum]|uniref:Cysteine-rich protein 2-like n=1 Tax=Platysternon megacephalum TaxID=55544 RepID=A0A4D9EIX8_9SAUR|nr:cysteine-rich protein 2-like [Platysternon megacephalum]